MNPEVELRRCANPVCNCHVDDERTFCSDTCQLGRGYQCRCDHVACSSAAALVWQNESSSFYGGRLL